MSVRTSLVARIEDWFFVGAGWLIDLVILAVAVACWWIPVPWLNAIAFLFSMALWLMVTGHLLEPTMKAAKIYARGWK